MARRGRPTVEIPVCGAAGHAHEPGCKASTSPRSQVFLPAGRDALATFAFQHVTAARDNGYWRCPPSKLERRSPRSHCAREPVEPLPFVDLSLRLVAAASPRGRRSTSVCGRPGLHQRGRKCRPDRHRRQFRNLGWRLHPPGPVRLRHECGNSRLRGVGRSWRRHRRRSRPCERRIT